MTVAESAPGLRGAESEPPLTELPGPPELHTIADHLPEQEWCTECVLDENSEPGVPRDIVMLPDEPEGSLPDARHDAGETGSLYEVTWLSCGHAIVRIPAPRWPGPLS